MSLHSEDLIVPYQIVDSNNQVKINNASISSSSSCSFKRYNSPPKPFKIKYNKLIFFLLNRCQVY
tara:strand:- start:466 stop:660 length:195 start_codon:yes stop_codon:yes gene_type:complete